MKEKHKMVNKYIINKKEISCHMMVDVIFMSLIESRTNIYFILFSNFKNLFLKRLILIEKIDRKDKEKKREIENFVNLNN